MNKPLIIGINDFEIELVDCINKYNIPATIKRRIVENIYNQLNMAEKEELEATIKAYEEEQKKDKKKEDK